MSPNRKIQHHFFALTCVFLAILAASCASPPQPPEVYSTSGVNSRTLVYPMVDMRAGNGLNIASCNPERPRVGNAMTSLLTKYGFAVDQDLKSDVSKDELDQKNAERLKRIPSGGHHYVALLYLEEFGYRNGFTTFAWKITAYIVRPDTGQIMWNYTYDDWSWQGALEGPLNAAGEAALGGTLYHIAIRDAGRLTTCGALYHLVQRTLLKGPPLPAY